MTAEHRGGTRAAGTPGAPVTAAPGPCAGEGAWAGRLQPPRAPRKGCEGLGGSCRHRAAPDPPEDAGPTVPKTWRCLPRASPALPLGQGKAPPSMTSALCFISPRRGFCLLLPKSQAREAKAVLNASKALCKCPASEELRGCFSWGQPGLRLPAGNLRAGISYRKGSLALRAVLSLRAPKRIRFGKSACKEFSLLIAYMRDSCCRGII